MKSSSSSAVEVSRASQVHQTPHDGAAPQHPGREREREEHDADLDRRRGEQVPALRAGPRPQVQRRAERGEAERAGRGRPRRRRGAGTAAARGCPGCSSGGVTQSPSQTVSTTRASATGPRARSAACRSGSRRLLERPVEQDARQRGRRRPSRRARWPIDRVRRQRAPRRSPSRRRSATGASAGSTSSGSSVRGDVGAGHEGTVEGADGRQRQRPRRRTSGVGERRGARRRRGRARGARPRAPRRGRSSWSGEGERLAEEHATWVEPEEPDRRPRALARLDRRRPRRGEHGREQQGEPEDPGRAAARAS